MESRLGHMVAVCVLATFARSALPAQTLGPVSMPEAPYQGKAIASINYEPDSQPYTRSTLSRINPVQPGDIFKIDNISQAIETLFETGRFEDIRAEAKLTDNGEVDLVFRTVPAWFVGEVSVSGTADPPNEGQLIAATKLELGQEFTEDFLIEATQNVATSLQENGFYRSSVEPRFEHDPLTQQVHIRFDINTGKRARFATPVFVGEPKRSTTSLLRATHWQRLWGLLSYKHLTEQRLSNGLERIRYEFQKDDFLMARVQLEKLEYLPKRNLARPTIRVDAGPRTEVRVTGARISRGRLRQLVPIYQERSVDRDLLVEGRRNITEYLQSRGFFDAEVDFNITEQRNPAAESNGPDQVIAFTVDRGVRYTLVHVEVSGNRYFDTNTIHERLSITPATRIRYRHGRFSADMLEKDLDAIRYLYRSNGFRDVITTSRVDKSYKGKEGDVAVFIQIEEGPQWFVSGLEISGVNLRDFEYVQSMLQSIESQPYAESNIAADRDFVLNYYYNNGFPNAAFEYSVQPAGEPHHVNIRYSVTEGPRIFVRRVLVGGYETTQPRLIFDRIPIESGEALSQSAIIEAQRRLYELGIFARVDFALQNPEGREREKYVLFRLEEARRYSFTFGFGAQLARIGGGTTTLDAPAGAPGFSPRVSFGVSRSNFRGVGHTLGFRGQLSNFQQRAAVTYFAPQFTGNEEINLNLTSLFEKSRDVRTFTAQRFENSIQLGQRLSRSNSIQYRYAFRRVSIDQSTLNIDPALIPVFAVPVRVGIFSSSFIRDRRDDPIASRKGTFTTVDSGIAHSAFGYGADFTRFLVRNSSYHPIGGDLVLARSLTFGSIYAFNVNPSARTASSITNLDVPLPERFFSGGGTTNRAFPDNQAGPRDLTTGFPLGGKALLTHSLELRFPLLGDSLGGVLFHDAGNVYSSLNKVSVRFRQRDIRDFDYMVHAVGFGIRFRTPVGPVRLDLAYGPNTPRFVGYRGTRDQLIQGGGTPVNQRISRFQFHFSLGQTF